MSASKAAVLITTMIVFVAIVKDRGVGTDYRIATNALDSGSITVLNSRAKSAGL